MALFQYQAISETGKKYKGHVYADTLTEAKRKLLAKDIFLTQIDPIRGKESSIILSKIEVLRFTQELSKLLKAGLPLYEALVTLEEKYQEQKSHRLILDLLDKVKHGRHLSEALQSHPKAFDDLYISMISNAEKSANLVLALEDLSKLLAKQIDLRKKALSTLLYPSLLLTFCVVVLSSLIFYVIPSLADLFEGRNLHPFTNFVLTFSKWANQMKLFLALFVVAAIGSFIFLLTLKKTKKFLFKTLLYLPIFKKIFMRMAFIRFCRSASILLLAGVPLIEALKLSRDVLRHPKLEEVFFHAEKAVMEGKSLAAELKKSHFVPKLVSRMLGIAEEGGKVPTMLQHIAQIYEEELDKNLSNLTTIAQPIILLFIGLVVGFVLLSVLLPLTDVSSFVNP